ncbi:VOC family protein [Pantoea allii]|uniref:VOC family protein n=1 Tax=Pantoea allii TaxID=574096 RepID=UPI0024B7E574|nr:VOC family protein [Pantoea allii]MDJ0041358.1 VOC family protein [Pantoea allii]
MFSHMVVGTDDIAQAKTFYDAIFAVIRCDDQGIDAIGRPYYIKNNQRFIITKPINGQPATFANGGTIGFTMPSSEEVFRLHQQGIENGGTSAETPPQVRETDGKCIAYLRDPTGNKLCAFYNPT